jgi:ACT domain-containing protein
MKKQKKHIIVTVIGRDEVGIVARIATSLAAQNINIIDINQTILGGEIFAMTLLADRINCDHPLPQITERLRQSVEGMALKVTVQDSDVFQYMHRV